MKVFNGVFIKLGDSWFIQYDTEMGNGIEITDSIMLHPNQISYAELNKECKFRIQQCPNFEKNGEWESMAIIDTGEAKKIGEIIEKFRHKEMFPRLNAHARDVLSNITTLPESKDETWDEIFENQARKDGANYRMLKEWLKNNYETPKKKNNEK